MYDIKTKDQVQALVNAEIGFGDERFWIKIEDADAFVDGKLINNQQTFVVNETNETEEASDTATIYVDSHLTYREMFPVKEVNGDTYLLLGRNEFHIINGERVPNGNFKFLTWEEVEPWVEVFEVTPLTDTELLSMETIYNTLDGAKIMVSNRANEYFNAIGAMGFESDCLGETKVFASDDRSVAQINGMVTVAQQNLIEELMGIEDDQEIVSWRAKDEDVCYPWENMQVIKLGKDLARASKELEHNRELTLVTIKEAQTIEEVLAIAEQLK